VKRFAARCALFGALIILPGCTISVAQQPASDEKMPSTEPAQPPASAQNTAPTEIVIVDKRASDCTDVAEKPCRNKKAEAEPPNMTARKVETLRKAEGKRSPAEQRKAKAAVLQRLTDERKAEEARKADAARIDNKAEEKRLADKFKRAFERGRCAWLNAE